LPRTQRRPAERIEGLWAFLEEAGLEPLVPAVEAWCEEAGAVELVELLDAPEELCDGLGLEGAERGLLLAAAARAFDDARHSRRSAAGDPPTHEELLLRPARASERPPDAGLRTGTAEGVPSAVSGKPAPAGLLAPRPVPAAQKTSEEKSAALAAAVARARRHLASADTAASPSSAAPPSASASAAARASASGSSATGAGTAAAAGGLGEEARKERAAQGPDLEGLFTVRLTNAHRSPSALGIHVDHADGETLFVERLAPGGLLERWNLAHPESAVEVGDRIVSVNGKSGDSVALINALGRSEELELVLRRPSSRFAAAASASARASPAPVGGASSSSEGQRRATEPKPLQVRRSQDGSTVTFEFLAGASERSAEGGLQWFRVISDAGIGSRLRPDHGVQPCFHLDHGELLEVLELKGAWAKLSPAELRRRALPEAPGSEATVGDAVRALARLGYGGGAVPAGAMGVVVTTSPKLGVNWLGFDALSDAVVFPEQVATLRQAWVPLFRPQIRGQRRGTGEDPALVEAPPPPARVLEEGGVVRWSLGGFADGADVEELQAEEAMRERVQEVEKTRSVEEGAARVVAENDKAWELFRARRREDAHAAAAARPG